MTALPILIRHKLIGVERVVLKLYVRLANPRGLSGVDHQGQDLFAKLCDGKGPTLVVVSTTPRGLEGVVTGLAVRFLVATSLGGERVFRECT